jgi:hypothetical protein
MLKYACDDASVVGDDHSRRGEVGQDYAVSGLCEQGRGRAAYAVVSDGCSTGRWTDLGSRLVCHNARALLKPSVFNPGGSALGDREFFQDRLRERLLTQERVLGLEDSDLYATCLCARIDERHLRVFACGDGVIVVQFKNGCSHAVKFEWSNNMPAYPVYGDLDLASLEAHGAAMVREDASFGQDSPPDASPERTTYSLRDSASGSTLTYSAEGVLGVALFSDGVLQVRGDAAEMGWQDVVRELCAFKNTAGVFAKRRMRAFVEGVRKQGYRIEDDLSYAVVRVERDESSQAGEGTEGGAGG